MKDSFLFSKQFLKIGSELNFQFKLFIKRLKLLFRFNNKLKKRSLDYFKYWRFENAYIVVYLYFQNALWYQIGDFKGLYSSEPIRINLNQFHSNAIELKVYGLFRKMTFPINLEKIAYLDNSNFIVQITPTEIPDLLRIDDELNFPEIKIAPLKNVQLNRTKPQIQSNQLKLINQIENISLTPFQINDHL